jgi:hypothetical protein
LKFYFGLEYKEIENLTKEWVGEHYKLKTTNTLNNYFGNFREVEEHYRLNNPTNS